MAGYQQPWQQQQFNQQQAYYQGQQHGQQQHQYSTPLQKQQQQLQAISGHHHQQINVSWLQQLPGFQHPQTAAWLDSLQERIAAFVERVVPNAQEQQHRDACLAAFTKIAEQTLPDHAQAMQVALFGSGAAGLSLHSSDLDVVLAGLAVPEPSKGGFDAVTKGFIVNCLRRLERACRWGAGRYTLGVQGGKVIGKARVPVLKLQLGSGTELDVSLNDDGGIKAVRFLQSFQQDYTAVRPLTLLLKCILKQRGLSDVSTGGLGSWSLVNMVLAHLMALSGTGEQVDHLGSMLLSFLQRFGVEFDLHTEAVAVKRGGFVKRKSLAKNFARGGILCLEDPLTGVAW
ncbi:hypothetical protein COO60DRAFT_1040617 [Scenedesmus sp. NREL 46B-D3]|nr:hypothetical protein COO60DRAFT_1040617 [Scenedesmus sp. NREL 46B-D3]